MEHKEAKRDKTSGFTIIEVVITIAIGAAVMALVLNAVAGARRSQRNNARAADVNQIAAGVNQYIATRNALPDDWGDISGFVEADSLGHYNASSINAAAAWSTTIPHPSNNGVFSEIQAIGGPLLNQTCTEDVDTGACAPTDPVVTGGAVLSSTPGCTSGNTVNGETCNYVKATGNTPAQPDATGKMGDGDADDADHVVVFRKASCTSTTAVGIGGIREMAIAYKLEGQNDIVCLEV